jgi:lysophospholipase L1-like esterase
LERVESRLRIRRRAFAAAAAAAAVAVATTIPAMAASGAQSSPSAAGGAGNWVTAWGASQVVGSDVPGSTCPAGTGLTDQTVRNVIFLSAGGSRVRIRLTNAFGTEAMRVGHASVAVQASGARAVRGTLHALTFGGRRAVTLAAGGAALSDPVPLRVAALSALLVSVYVPGPTGPVTNHPFTAQGNYLGRGDLAGSVSGAAYGDTPCWMLVSGVNVSAPAHVIGTVVALGDSITDTANTTGNANRRWPDDLARRLNALPGPTLSVVNAGLGGNRLLAPRPGQPYYGVPALARLDRDVFAQTGVRAVILLEGVNDIGYNATADEIIVGYQQIIARSHARGLAVYGATITPFGGSIVDSAPAEKTRTDVNTWITTSHAFDGVIDFAAAVADPGRTTALNPSYDSGDHLHPNDAGCQAMAGAIDLRMLTRNR